MVKANCQREMSVGSSKVLPPKLLVCFAGPHRDSAFLRILFLSESERCSFPNRLRCTTELGHESRERPGVVVFGVLGGKEEGYVPLFGALSDLPEVLRLPALLELAPVSLHELLSAVRLVP